MIGAVFFSCSPDSPLPSITSLGRLHGHVPAQGRDGGGAGEGGRSVEADVGDGRSGLGRRDVARQPRRDLDPALVGEDQGAVGHASPQQLRWGEGVGARTRARARCPNTAPQPLLSSHRDHGKRQQPHARPQRVGLFPVRPAAGRTDPVGRDARGRRRRRGQGGRREGRAGRDRYRDGPDGAQGGEEGLEARAEVGGG